MGLLRLVSFDTLHLTVEGGIIGGSAALDSTITHGGHPRSVKLSAATDTYTIDDGGAASPASFWSFWLYFDALPSSDSKILDHDSGANQMEILTTGALRYTDGAAVTTTGSRLLEVGQWHHILFDHVADLIYVDGGKDMAPALNATQGVQRFYGPANGAIMYVSEIAGWNNVAESGLSGYMPVPLDFRMAVPKAAGTYSGWQSHVAGVPGGNNWDVWDEKPPSGTGTTDADFNQAPATANLANISDLQTATDLGLPPGFIMHGAQESVWARSTNTDKTAGDLGRLRTRSTDYDVNNIGWASTSYTDGQAVFPKRAIFSPNWLASDLDDWEAGRITSSTHAGFIRADALYMVFVITPPTLVPSLMAQARRKRKHYRAPTYDPPIPRRMGILQTAGTPPAASTRRRFALVA